MGDPEKHTILGVHITNRVQEAVDVQRVLTEYGYMIKTRLGLHELRPDSEGPNGLLIVEPVGDDETIQQLSDKLNTIEGVEVQSMVFYHP